MTTKRALTQAITIVLPVYNETHRAGPSVIALLDFVRSLPTGSELVFVDDGSQDGTAELIEKALATHDAGRLARVLVEPHRGKGAATRTGLLSASTPLVGFCDIDLATPLPSFLEVAIAAERAPVLAIGSRDVVGSRLLRSEPAVREFLGRAYNRAVQLLVVPGITDTQCGAKVARRDVWSSFLGASVEDGFAWDVEICGLAAAAGHPVLEVGIDWIHEDGSNINVVRDGIAMLAALPRIRRTTLRFQRTQRRARVLRWQDRSTAALVASALRRFPPQVDGQSATLIDLGGRGQVAGLLGWHPQPVVLLVDETPRRRTPFPVVVGDLDSVPIIDGSAAVVLVRAERIDAEQVAAAARLLRPGGVLVTIDHATPARQLGGLARDARCRVELATPVFAWTTRAGLRSGQGRGALVWTAVERLAVARLGLRMPRGAAAMVVARRLARS